MLSAVLEIEVGVSELLVAVLVIGGVYLALQWWRASLYKTSGVSGAAPAVSLAPLSNGRSTASVVPVGQPAAAGAAASASGKEIPVTIFFGSQSGTAETFANELAEESKQYGFRATVQDLGEYDADMQLADESFVVFLMSTFGEGDPTDNAAEFYEWITSDQREPGSLSKLTFGVFALGNRQYEHFCNIGRRVDQRLGELGGSRLLEHGEGDDDGSLEDDFSGWKSSFWARTKQTFGLADSVGAAAQVFKPSFAMEWLSTEAAARHKRGLQPAICDPKLKPILATVVQNKQLRDDVKPAAEGTNALAVNSEGDSTCHLEFDVSALRLSYVTADNLGVCPCNGSAGVEAMLARLKLDPAAVFSLRVLGKRKLPVSSPCSVLDALTWYLDFEAHPRAALLATLQQYTDDEAEKATLAGWTTGAGKEEFTRDEKSLLEVLQAVPGLNVPFLALLELCPKLQPRFYTISSSSLVQPKQVAITVALSTHQKPRGRVYHGLATTYLCGLKPGDKACVFIRPSTFRLPKPKRTFAALAPAAAGAAPGGVSSTSVLPPVIMVGPGTGVAPFRAFVQEFGFLAARSLPVYPSTHLFFGCRHSKADYIYRDEFEAALKAGSLSKLHTAFSRDSDQKVYVQSHLKEHAEQVWQLLSQQRAYFFVCGGTVMGRQVKETVANIAVQHGNMTQQAANEWVKKLHTEGRYVQELWS